MKTCTKCGIEKPLTEFYKQRNDLHASCKACVYARAAMWRKENPERKRATDKARYSANPVKQKIASSKWRIANPDKEMAAIRAWRKANRERHNATARKWRDANVEKARAKYVAWAKNNKALRAMCKAERKARKLRSTPAWADQSSIKRLYLEAQEKTKSTGKTWQVDHIVPLKSQLVCGLHVEHNLRVIPASENSSKKNYYWPDMP